MEDSTTAQVIAIQETGSDKLRNQFLSDWQEKAYGIAKTHSRKFGRKPTDDELSVSLRAVNEAINSFHLDKHKQFGPFAYRVIINKLIDHFKQDKATVSYKTFDDEELTLIADKKVSSEYESMERSKDLAQQRRDELVKLERIMNNLNFTLKDILDSKPEHKDSLQEVQKLAMHIVGLKLGERFIKENPHSRELIRLIGVDSRIIKRYRPYLTAWIVTFVYNFPAMRSFLNSYRKGV